METKQTKEERIALGKMWMMGVPIDVKSTRGRYDWTRHSEYKTIAERSGLGQYYLWLLVTEGYENFTDDQKHYVGSLIYRISPDADV